MPPLRRRSPITILIAEDDEDDRVLIRDAFSECRLTDTLHFVNDGEELLDYLHARGQYGEHTDAPPLGLILLDLNMPRKDGREVLVEIKADPELRSIPIVVLTTSKAMEDVRSTYDLGVSSYITKPSTFEELVDLFRTVVHYWLEIVRLPPPHRPA